MGTLGLHDPLATLLWGTVDPPTSSKWVMGQCLAGPPSSSAEQLTTHGRFSGVVWDLAAPQAEGLGDCVWVSDICQDIVQGL